MRRFKDSTENKRSIAKFKLSFRCVKTENTKHCATHWTVEVRCLLKTKSRTNRPLYKWIIYKDLLDTQNSLWWIQTNEWYIISLEVSLLTSCVIEKPFANAWLGFKISNQRDLIKAPGVTTSQIDFSLHFTETGPRFGKNEVMQDVYVMYAC